MARLEQNLIDVVDVRCAADEAFVKRIGPGIGNREQKGLLKTLRGIGAQVAIILVPEMDLQGVLTQNFSRRSAACSPDMK